ncbi:MAG: OmpA family protein [Gemmatimonadaceae bacterium]|nr:OmpA family protein [Gemmatimonadaceae bacterium]
MAKGGSKVVIVKKVKKGGHGHHGGSWKVAYADFVTAMMAFFMVMWILGMDENTRKAIEGYFSNPIGFKKGYSSGSSPLASGSSPASVQQQAMQIALRSLQQRRFEEIKAMLATRVDSLAARGAFRSKVEITLTNAGLRIELIENQQGNTFFDFGSSRMKPQGELALKVVAEELVGMENPLVIEGHTDAAQYTRPDYSNWELSSERANAARRFLERVGIPRSRIVEVNGLADTQPKYPLDPMNPSNRRISILLPYITAPQPATLEALKERLGTAAGG